MKQEDYASARIATSLGPRLLDEAKRAAGESQAAADSGDLEQLNVVLQRCLVAILCAHAAVEAHMNETGARELGDLWWICCERSPLEQKWIAIAHKRTGKAPAKTERTRVAIRRLSEARNQVAHFKGFPQPDGTYDVSAPPVTAKGGISKVRAEFDATRARAAVDDAGIIFESL